MLVSQLNTCRGSSVVERSPGSSGPFSAMRSAKLGELGEHFYGESLKNNPEPS
jgi:hypothetical protein